MPCHRINKVGTHAHHRAPNDAEAIFANGTYFLDNPRILRHNDVSVLPKYRDRNSYITEQLGCSGHASYLWFISCRIHISVRRPAVLNEVFRDCFDCQLSSRLLLEKRQYYSMKNCILAEFYVYGSVHRWSILITVQRDATQICLFIILQVHCTCFRCQPHPSSGIHKTVTTASGTVQLPPSNAAKLAWPRWREVAAQYRRL